MGVLPYVHKIIKYSFYKIKNIIILSIKIVLNVTNLVI